MRYITTGSAIERLHHCPASAALPHTHFETQWTERGTAIHKFLENLSAVGREAALAMVPEEFREVCSALELEGLDMQLALGAEIAIAYNVRTGQARELGRGKGRKYDDVTEDEIPTTLDAVGVNAVARSGLVVDWKSGWTTRTPLRSTLQLFFGGLASARCYDLDTVDVQLIHVREDFDPWVQTATMSSFDLDAFAGEIERVFDQALEIRAQIASGKMPKTWNTGPWCRRCPGFTYCPAHTAMLKTIVSGDYMEDLRRMRPMTVEQAVGAWKAVRSAMQVLRTVEGAIYALAKEQPLYLGTADDGKHHWLAEVYHEGNEKLDGEVAFNVLAEMFDDDAASDATKLTTTKDLIAKTVKARVKRGEGKKTIDAVYDKIRAEKGSFRKPTISVKEIATKDANPPAPPPALPPATGSDEGDE